DKVGVPYILHPLRVMHLVEEHGPVAMTAAVLHDVIEDTELELDDLRRIGVPEVAVEAVDSLSRRGRGFPPGQVTGETYEDYIQRLSHNPRAVRVKIADAIDNSSPKRPLPQRPELTQRYLKTIEQR